MKCILIPFFRSDSIVYKYLRLQHIEVRVHSCLAQPLQTTAHFECVYCTWQLGSMSFAPNTLIQLCTYLLIYLVLFFANYVSYQSVPQPRNSQVGFGKPTLEFLRWTLEFQRGNSNVQRRNSKVGFFISAQIFSKFDDFYNLNEFVIIYWYNIH